MDELTLKVKQNPGAIKLNFEELEKAIDDKLKEYKGMQYTEDTKDIAKKEVAYLRKQKKELDEARKKVKSEWMKPYDEFEKKVKDLLEKYDDPIDLIHGQILEFEELRRKEKKAKIEQAYQELVGDMADILHLDKIYDPKWENATTTMKSIKESILTSVESAGVAIDSIKAMHSEKEAEAIRLYKDTLDMGKAMTLIANYESQKKEILAKAEAVEREKEERRIQAEIERTKAAEREALAREERARQEGTRFAERKTMFSEPEDKPLIPDDELPFEQPNTITAFYRVVATKKELEDVEAILNSIGIYFERRDA